MSDFLYNLELAFKEHNFPIDGQVDTANPKFQRFRIKGKRNGKDLFVKIIGGHAGAVFGDWHDRSTWVTWWEKPWNTLNLDEKQKRKAEFERFKQQEIEERRSSILDAQELFDSAIDVDLNHPYILKKRINPVYCYQLDERIIVPVYNTVGHIQSLQIIWPNGFKHFFSGTSPTEGNLVMSENVPEKFYLCEGYATGCTLYEILGPQVVVCFSASNLINVALHLKSRHPLAEKIICADNDYLNSENKGLEYAEEAARVSDSFLTFPTFDHLPSYKFDEISAPSDFNDLINLSGWEEVEKQLLGNRRTVR